ncbi:MAG: Nif3-like dinuclear metal center hexameric protein [Thermoleophilia bacterium]|nr:Nif3-like dinuclear metal center hexameric protein [Thermoleophilia bacterium]
MSGGQSPRLGRYGHVWGTVPRDLSLAGVRAGAVSRTVPWTAAGRRPALLESPAVADRDAILEYAAELLDLGAFDDYGPMGMQVAGAREVRKVAAGVSASLELFERAAAAEAQLLVVHHGLFWNNDSRVVDERMRRRLEALFAADLTLAAYHLALDAHPEVGNNALLARALGIDVDATFAGIGVGGRLREPCPAGGLASRARDVLARDPLVFAHGPARIERVAVVTGGGGKYLVDAAREGYDAFVTGEPEEPSLHTAKELGLHFLAAGHYATERLGVQALTRHVAERFGLEWEFIEIPNPV